MILAAIKAALWIGALAGFMYFWYWMIKEGENVKRQKYDAIEDDYI
jgi:hypothetical protein